MSYLILILGGARSGKSAMAQQLAEEYGGEQVLFVATAEAGDEEMRQRIEAHRRARPRAWRTLEASRDVAGFLRAAYRGERAIIVDCLTLLVANVLATEDDSNGIGAQDVALAEVDALIKVLRETNATALVVSNEVGMGLVPPYPLGRAYRDVLGMVNQRVAAAADRVLLMVAGIPVTVKGLTSALTDRTNPSITKANPFARRYVIWKHCLNLSLPYPCLTA